MRWSKSILKAPHRRSRTPRGVSRAALVVCLVGVPLGASTAQQSTLEDNPAAFEGAVETVPFGQHFNEVIDPLDSSLTDIDPMTPSDAVDLSSFEPPVEQERVVRHLGNGTASYYGRKFHGRRTANGERFDMGAMTAAHSTLPFGSLVRVTNPRTGDSVVVRINDRGPFARGREIDLSRAAAQEIGLIRRGHGNVELELLAP